MCVSIYPVYADLMNRVYDDNLNSMLLNTQPREMLSCWHEASSMNYSDRNGLIQDWMQVAMQTYLYNFAKTGDGHTCPTPFQIQNPKYQVAVGGIDIGNWSKVEPWMAPNLDFYGIDLYFDNFNDPCTPLEEWQQHVYYGTSTTPAHSPNATIAVCECNCSCDYDRAAYFQEAASWVWNQTNRGARSFLTFWNGTGNLGGCWPPGCDTIDELMRIGNQDYSIQTTLPPKCVLRTTCVLG